jgi:hypothetical protein
LPLEGLIYARSGVALAPTFLDNRRISGQASAAASARRPRTYATSEREAEMVNEAFSPSDTGNETGNELSETEHDSKSRKPCK